jgi:hypothetical protein
VYLPPLGPCVPDTIPASPPGGFAGDAVARRGKNSHADRLNEIYSIPLIVDGVCNEPWVILCLELFHPDLTQNPSLAVSPMGVLEDLLLDLVEPVNDSRREPFAIFGVAWSSDPCRWQLPPPPLDGLGKSCLDPAVPSRIFSMNQKGRSGLSSAITANSMYRRACSLNGRCCPLARAASLRFKLSSTQRFSATIKCPPLYSSK